MTAVEFLIKEFSDILGPIETTVMGDLLLVDAIKKAKEMEEQQKGYSKEEVIQLLIKMNSWPTTFDGEADISEWFEQVKSE